MYIVHSLIHLTKFVRTRGPLDNFSCFWYKNYLEQIKNCLKPTKYPLQETYNRLMEKQNIELSQEFELPKMYNPLMKLSTVYFLLCILPMINILKNDLNYSR